MPKVNKQMSYTLSICCVIGTSEKVIIFFAEHKYIKPSAVVNVKYTYYDMTNSIERLRIILVPEK